MLPPLTWYVFGWGYVDDFQSFFNMTCWKTHFTKFTLDRQIMQELGQYCPQYHKAITDPMSAIPNPLNYRPGSPEAYKATDEMLEWLRTTWEKARG